MKRKLLFLLASAMLIAAPVHGMAEEEAVITEEGYEALTEITEQKGKRTAVKRMMKDSWCLLKKQRIQVKLLTNRLLPARRRAGHVEKT
ncbi:MAG: hypothetical protein LUH20_03750 [Lachnospiraceae bacterium]|nr:hypothetical protein [Lachnospiraceae bacterium]